MPTDTFYAAVTTISFTLLGLWWVVVEGRPGWRRQPARRLLAYLVSLHFLLPGAMSVLSLVSPDVGLVWRISFAVSGTIGVLGVLLVIRALIEEADCPRIVRGIQWIVLPIYVLITALAVAPDLIAGLGLRLSALQVEAIIVAILLFFGVQSAWVLMIELGDVPARPTEG